MKRQKKTIDAVVDERMTAKYQAETPAVLEGWTEDETFELYLGIKHNSYDTKEIQKRLPKRTEEQIQAVIDYFRTELVKKTTGPLSSRPKRRIKPVPQVPLAKWADLMTETYEYKELQTEYATAVRLIAEFEDHPNPSICNGIDFKKIYHYMADAMEGKPLPEDTIAAEIFNHCIMECSSMSKQFVPKHELEDILADPSTVGHNSNVPRPTKDGGLAALRHLITQRNYNPLNIPEKYLKHAESYTKDNI